MNTRRKNNLKSGSTRFIIFEEDHVWYGACLEFNIVEVGSTPQEAMILLFEATRGYLESAQKIKAPVSVLNQATDPEYERLWEVLQDTHRKPPASIFSFGEMNISQKRGSRIP